MLEYCPQGHRLEVFITGHDWQCSRRHGEWLSGAMFGGCLQCRWDMCPACRVAPAGRAPGTPPKSAPRMTAAPASPGHHPRPSVAPPTAPPQLRKRDRAAADHRPQPSDLESSSEAESSSRGSDQISALDHYERCALRLLRSKAVF